MNWIVASGLMFISSVILYLLVRKSNLLKTPSQFNNLAMFALPLLFYVTLALVRQIDLSLTWYQFGIIVILSVFFSYLGNVASLKSIEAAPNPGYSLILSKSYVVFTTLVAVIVFDADLTLKAIAAIVAIITGSALITLSKQTAKQAASNNGPWLPLAILAFFCWGMLSLTSKYLLTIGVAIIPRLVYSMSIVTGLVLLEIKVRKTRWQLISRPQLLVLLGIGIAGASFNYFMQVGFDTAPNLGYVNALNASSIAAVSLFSALFFKDELTKRKLLGILTVTLGLILLVT